MTRTLQLDKLLVTRDWSHLKLSNFEHARQCGTFLGQTAQYDPDPQTMSPPVRAAL